MTEDKNKKPVDEKKKTANSTKNVKSTSTTKNTKPQAAKKPTVASVTKKTIVDKPTVNKSSLISKELYDQAVSYVSVLFLYEDTINLIKKDEVFSKNVCHLIDVINTYEESNKVKDERTDDFLVAYKTLKNASYDPKVLKVADIDEIDDQMSFITVYIKNTINKEWSDIVASFKGKDTKAGLIASIQTQKIQSQNAEQANTEAKTSEQNYSQQSTGFAGAFAQAAQNTGNQSFMADAQLTQAANMLYFRDVLKNDIYIFDSKPSIYVWIKWLYIFLGIIFSLAMLGTSIFQVATKQGFFLLNEAVDNKATYDWWTTNVVPIGGWQNTIFSILTIFFVLYIFMSMFDSYSKEIKNYKNDNYRYSCSHSVFNMSAFALFILIIMPFIITPNLPFAKIVEIMNAPRDYAAEITVSDANNTVININNAQSFGTVLAAAVLQYILIGTFCVNLILSVSIRAISPKKNREKIMQNIKEHFADLKSGKVSLEKVVNESQTNARATLKDLRRFI